MLPGADGAITEQTTNELSTPGAQTLILGFNPAGHGAVLDA